MTLWQLLNLQALIYASPRLLELHCDAITMVNCSHLFWILLLHYWKPWQETGTYQHSSQCNLVTEMVTPNQSQLIVLINKLTFAHLSLNLYLSLFNLLWLSLSLWSRERKRGYRKSCFKRLDENRMEQFQEAGNFEFGSVQQMRCPIWGNACSCLGSAGGLMEGMFPLAALFGRYY